MLFAYHGTWRHVPPISWDSRPRLLLQAITSPPITFLVRVLTSLCQTSSQSRPTCMCRAQLPMTPSTIPFEKQWMWNWQAFNLKTYNLYYSGSCNFVLPANVVHIGTILCFDHTFALCYVCFLDKSLFNHDLADEFFSQCTQKTAYAPHPSAWPA